MIIEPQWEPLGEGRGWYVAPSDDKASLFVILDASGEPVDACVTRKAAESAIARALATRRLIEAMPAPVARVKRPNPFAVMARWSPLVLAFWVIAAWLKAHGSG